LGAGLPGERDGVDADREVRQAGRVGGVPGQRHIQVGDSGQGHLG
jgi:hypothetical protein